MESTVADFELGGVTRTRNGGVLKGVAPSNAYPTSDDRDVVIAANADAVFARLCEAMDRPDLAYGRALRRARGARREPGGARRRDRGVERAALRGRSARRARAPLGPVGADPCRGGSRDRPAVRRPGDGAPARGRLRPAGADGRRRPEALAHARGRPLRRPRARRAHRRRPAGPRGPDRRRPSDAPRRATSSPDPSFWRRENTAEVLLRRQNPGRERRGDGWVRRRSWWARGR